MDEELNPQELRIEEMADLHSRVSLLESTFVVLSRRITSVENGARGSYDDDPMKAMQPMIWIMVALTVAPIVLDLVKQWRSSE